GWHRHTDGREIVQSEQGMVGHYESWAWGDVVPIVGPLSSIAVLRSTDIDWVVSIGISKREVCALKDGRILDQIDDAIALATIKSCRIVYRSVWKRENHRDQVSLDGRRPVAVIIRAATHYAALIRVTILTRNDTVIPQRNRRAGASLRPDRCHIRLRNV